MRISGKFEVIAVTESGAEGKRVEIQRVARKAVLPGEKDVYESTRIPVRDVQLMCTENDEAAGEFSSLIPAGTISLHVTNVELANEFKPGQSYFVDLTPNRQ